MKQFVQLIEEAGGYVNPSLILLVGEDALHGELSLAGVPDDELAIRVPYKLEEFFHSLGPWAKFCESLGQEITYQWYRAREPLLPILSACGHSDNGGKLIAAKDGWELYGTTCCYSEDKNVLRNLYGIES